VSVGDKILTGGPSAVAELLVKTELIIDTYDNKFADEICSFCLFTCL